jgi:hypothetical protein
LLILAFGSFDEFAVVEGGAGSDQGNQVRGVDHPPARLGCFDQLERLREAGGAVAGAFGDPLTEPDGGEGRLD